MKIKVWVRLHMAEGYQEGVEAILSNVEPGRIGEPILLVDGKEWTGLYDQIRVGGVVR